MRLLTFTLLAVLASFAACGASRVPSGGVHVLTAKGVVNPVMARYIDRGIGSAEKDAAAAVVIKLDTPGGLVSSMNKIVQHILNARVPVIVYVAPAGAQAASAGTFITLAGHVAAMADATRIGAATPVTGGGEDVEGALGKKVTEDTVALITGVAEKRGRNAEWAERAVREAVSANEREAVSLNVVDLVAADLATLLAKVDGRQVELPSGTATLRTKDAPIVFNSTNFVENFLDVISNPNIAFILLNLGIIALLIELYNPGVILPGVVGAVSLVVAFFALDVLPVNWVGVFFIVLAFALFLLEAHITSYGFLALGGIASLVGGGLILTGGNPPEFRISPWLLWGLAAAMGAFFAFVMASLLRARRLPVVMGNAQSLVGRTAVARTSLQPTGTVFVAGEDWSAMAEDGPIPEGETVVVTRVDGLTLRVKRP